MSSNVVQARCPQDTQTSLRSSEQPASGQWRRYLATMTPDAALDWRTMLRDELLSAVPRLRRLPDRFDRIMTLAARGDLRVQTEIHEDRGRTLRTLVNRALLAAVGSVLLLVGAVLLVGAENGPTVSPGTGLYEIFGYGGLLAGSVLLLRVVAAVARDGTT